MVHGVVSQYQRNTYSKWPMANLTVTWPITSFHGTHCCF